MRTWDWSDVQWRKSSYSGADGQNGNCVEAVVTSHDVGIRDTKSPERGTFLLDTASWHTFLQHLTRGS